MVHILQCYPMISQEYFDQQQPAQPPRPHRQLMQQPAHHHRRRQLMHFLQLLQPLCNLTLNRFVHD